MKVANVDKFYAEEGDEFPPVDDQDLPEELEDVEDTLEDELEDELGVEVEVELGDEEAAEEEILDEVPTDEVELDEELPVDQDILPGKQVIVDVDGEEKPGTILSFNPQDGFAIVKLDQLEEVQDELQDEEGIEGLQDEEGALELPEGEEGVLELPEGEEGEEFVQPVQAQMEIEVHESKITVVADPIFEQEKSIKDTISQLITEAKKRKASEEQDPHFLLFLSESNKEIWGELSMDDKEKVNVAINESTYTSEQDVLKIIRESLSASSKTEEETLVDAIPDDLVSVWNGLNDVVKQSVLSQAKFYPNLVGSQPKMESFWNSRDLEQYSDDPLKAQLNEGNHLISESKLSENQIDRFIGAFKNLS